MNIELFDANGDQPDRHQGRRRGRGRLQRRQPHDRHGPEERLVRRDQHRPAGAAQLERRDAVRHRHEAHRRPGRGRHPRDRGEGRPGGPGGHPGPPARARTWSSSPPAWAAARARARRPWWRTSPGSSAPSPWPWSPSPSTSRASARCSWPRRASSACAQEVDTLITIPNQHLLQHRREAHADPRGVLHGRRRPAPGRAGHLGPHHRAGRDQHRLRRRAHDHEGQGRRADGHRHRHAARTGPPTRPPTPSTTRCSRTPASKAPRASS